jgi:serine/threonine protein kinase
MTPTSDSRVGSYEILAAIGAGGRGEVYRARDAKLGRDVALKLLPDAFARDAERTARFQREAKVLASLNHTNIALIYGLEDSGATHALVMELVEGPTLADRIKRGAIPIDEALPIAKQICEALKYAHVDGVSSLWIRSLDSLEAHPLIGSESPVFHVYCSVHGGAAILPRRTRKCPLSRAKTAIHSS